MSGWSIGGPAAPGAQISAPQQAATTSSSTTGGNMNWLTILSTLLQLVPIIGAGVSAIHSDKNLGQKQQIAQDALTTAIAGATVALPPAEASMAQGIGDAAKNALSSVITALHASTTTTQPAGA